MTSPKPIQNLNSINFSKNSKNLLQSLERETLSRAPPRGGAKSIQSRKIWALPGARWNGQARLPNTLSASFFKVHRGGVMIRPKTCWRHGNPALPEVSGILRLNYFWHETDLILADQRMLCKCMFNLYSTTKSVESFLVDLVVVAADLFCWFFVGLCLRLKQIPYCQRWEFPAWKGWNELKTATISGSCHCKWSPDVISRWNSAVSHAVFLPERKSSYDKFFRFLPETACLHKKQSDWTAAVAQGSLA